MQLQIAVTVSEELPTPPGFLLFCDQTKRKICEVSGPFEAFSHKCTSILPNSHVIVNCHKC